jgi:positive regulator of sigma E activity
MSYFALYMIGTILVTAAVAYGVHLLGASDEWVIVVAILLLGSGIMSAARHTQKNK